MSLSTNSLIAMALFSPVLKQKKKITTKEQKQETKRKTKQN